MVTNRHEAVAQAEIVIDGKTYYGSCKGCAEEYDEQHLNPFCPRPLYEDTR